MSLRCRNWMRLSPKISFKLGYIPSLVHHKYVLLHCLLYHFRFRLSTELKQFYAAANPAHKPWFEFMTCFSLTHLSYVKRQMEQLGYPTREIFNNCRSKLDQYKISRKMCLSYLKPVVKKVLRNVVKTMISVTPFSQARVEVDLKFGRG